MAGQARKRAFPAEFWELTGPVQRASLGLFGRNRAPFRRALSSKSLFRTNASPAVLSGTPDIRLYPYLRTAGDMNSWIRTDTARELSLRGRKRPYLTSARLGSPESRPRKLGSAWSARPLDSARRIAQYDRAGSPRQHIGAAFRSGRRPGRHRNGRSSGRPDCDDAGANDGGDQRGGDGLRGTGGHERCFAPWSGMDLQIR